MVSVPIRVLRVEEREPSAASADPPLVEPAMSPALAEAMAFITSGPKALSSTAVESFVNCIPLPDCCQRSALLFGALLFVRVALRKHFRVA